MNEQFSELKYQLRDAARRTPDTFAGHSPDRLALVAVAGVGIGRFLEGYHGKKVWEAAKEKARRTRSEDPARYQADIARRAPLLKDMVNIQRDLRLLETITTTDLTYAIGEVRDAERRDPEPGFTTDLFGMVRRRTRDNMQPIKTRDGVRLIDRFLDRRPEGTVHKLTSWTGRFEHYAMTNFELGFNITWEAAERDGFSEFEDAMFELGEAAQMTRALQVLDAIRSGATFLQLPDGQLGPTITNVHAAQSHLGHQVIDGRTYARTGTDLYVPPVYASTARSAVGAATLQAVGGGAGGVQLIDTTNPVLNLGPVHPESIIAEAPVDLSAHPGQSNRDWILANAGAEPVEFAVHRLFEGGPRILTRIPDIVEIDDLGSYADHLIDVKVSDLHGAAVRSKADIVLVQGT